MSCHDEKKVCCEKFELAKTDMVAAGFDPSYIGDLIAQYGNDVVGIVADALRSGFSKQWIVDMLLKFGPVILRFLLDWFTKTQNKSLALGVVDGLEDQAKVAEAGLIE